MVARLRSRQLTSLLDQLESTAHWGSSFTQTLLLPLPLLPPLIRQYMQYYDTDDINMPESSSVRHRKQQFQHTYSPNVYYIRIYSTVLYNIYIYIYITVCVY
jgi:hypothetical protein